MPETNRAGLPSDEELQKMVAELRSILQYPISDVYAEVLLSKFRQVRERTLRWAADECSETAKFTKDVSARYTARQLWRAFSKAAEGGR